jgi:secretion/DNA translocation related TadE-like protein
MSEDVQRVGDEGSASLILLAAVGLWALGLALVLGVSQVRVSAARAQAAADLSALAAADTARGLSEGEPCATAEVVASANRAQLVSCAVHEDIVRIEVTAWVLRGSASLTVTRTAVAGPPSRHPDAAGIPGAR